MSLLSLFTRKKIFLCKCNIADFRNYTLMLSYCIYVLISVALSTGAIVEIPWAFLDPRRASGGGGGEEGVPPYAPELPLPAEAVLNYNRSLHRVRALHTHPAGIESTSLVLATGLGQSYTHSLMNERMNEEKILYLNPQIWSSRNNNHK